MKYGYPPSQLAAPLPDRRPRPRGKTNPFRVLSYSLYARTAWVTRRVVADGVNGTGETQVRLEHGGICRALNFYSASQLAEYLEWLEQGGWIRDLAVERGASHFVIPHPRSWGGA